jgi:hypothetical protein
MSVLVRIIADANGNPTPHDGRWVVRWNPHTKFGVCDIQSTSDIRKARRFANPGHAVEEWRTISRVQLIRPTDGKPNRPLNGLSIEITKEGA